MCVMCTGTLEAIRGTTRLWPTAHNADNLLPYTTINIFIIIIDIDIISRVCFFIVIIKRVFLLFNIYFRADTSVLIFRRSVLFFCRWTHKFCFFYFAVKMQEFITTIIIVKAIIILIKGTRSAGIPLESGANKNLR